MPSGHSEITAYINDGDIARVAAALTAVAAAEGLRPVPLPSTTYARQVLSPSDGWTLALLPGAPGWTVVLANPWKALCEPSATGPSRFVDVCSALGVRGFMVDVIDVRPQGGVLVETDGAGLHRISGYYTSEETSDLVYHGVPLETTEDFTGLTTFEVCADLDCAQPLADEPGIVTMDLCAAIAEEVGGANGQRFWSSGEDFSGAWATIQSALYAGGPLPVPGALMLAFEAEQPGGDGVAPRMTVSRFDVRALAQEFEGVDDFAGAADCYRRAAGLGDPESAGRLGGLYREGRGVPRDDVQSQAWFAEEKVLRARVEAEIAARPARNR